MDPYVPGSNRTASRRVPNSLCTCAIAMELSSPWMADWSIEGLKTWTFVPNDGAGCADETSALTPKLTHSDSSRAAAEPAASSSLDLVVNFLIPLGDSSSHDGRSAHRTTTSWRSFRSRDDLPGRIA